MLRPPDVNFADLQVGTVSQCFSCNKVLTIALVNDCKNTKNIWNCKN